MIYTEIETEIQGHKCIAQMTNYSKGWAGTYWEPPEPPEAEFDILDMDGCRWLWLEEQMTDEEALEIEEELIKTAGQEWEDERAIQQLNRIRGK